MGAAIFLNLLLASIRLVPSELKWLWLRLETWLRTTIAPLLVALLTRT